MRILELNRSIDDNQTKESGIDIPFESDESTYQVQQMDENAVTYLERHAEIADKMEKHVYKRHALNLLIGCGIGYFVLVIGDTIVTNLGWVQSPLAEGLVELLKFIISTLIGFVFSDKLKDK